MDELDLGSTIRGFIPGQKVFTRYTLKKILGRGGMGVVWLARDEELEREVALKFLPEVVAMDKQAILELKRETRRSLELTHPHIIRIYDFVQGGRTAAITMEYIPGDTLAALKVDQPRQCYPAAGLGKWVRQLCEALDYAHEKAQVVHRDLKPANLMVDARGDLRIADFGIAASVSDSVSRVSNQAGSSGTPVYMSPQQMMGEKPAVSDDIYSLGATLYDLITGKPPFHSGNIIAQVQSKVPASLSERLRDAGIEEPVPPEWEQTIAACLAKEPKDRPQSAGEVAERLGLAARTNTQRPTSNADRSTANLGRPASGPATVPARPSEIVNRKSKTSLYAVLTAGVIALAGLGWYFGIQVPGQKLQQEAQLKLALEQKQQAEERELAAAIKAVEVHLAAAEWVKAEVELAAMQRTGAGKPEGWSGQWAAAAGKLEATLRQKREEARLGALRVPVTVRTNPSGAEIVLDGVSRGSSPLAGLPLALGSHQLVLRLAGYDEVEQGIDVTEKGKGEWSFALARSSGKVALQVRPADAEYALFAVDENGRRASNTPRYSGTAGGEPLTAETGRYEVLITPKAKTAGLEHRETIVVRRGETATVAADVRTGSLRITSTPSGAEVWQDGRRAGVTPFMLENLVPKKAVAVELRLAGHQPVKESVLIASADAPQEWQADLKKNAIPLRADFRNWKRKVETTVWSESTQSASVTSGGKTEEIPASTKRHTATALAEILAFTPEGWVRAARTLVKDLSGDTEITYLPGTLVQHDRIGQNWQASFTRGGFAKAGDFTVQALTSANPLLWLDAESLPEGPVASGAGAEGNRTWQVPLRAASILLPGLHLENPQGRIDGRIKAADTESAQPWVELEYQFDLSGAFSPAIFPAAEGYTRSGSARYQGTLTVPLDLAGRYASAAELRFRGEGKMVVTPKQAPTASAVTGLIAAGLVKAAAAKAASSSSSSSDFKVENTTTVQVRPLDDQVDLTAQAAPPVQPKVPVYFARKNNVLMGIALRLGADLRGEPLVRLSDGTYQKIELVPGTYSINIVYGLGENLGSGMGATIEIVAGRTNYFEIALGMSKPQIHMLSETEGTALIARLKPTKLMGNPSP